MKNIFLILVFCFSSYSFSNEWNIFSNLENPKVGDTLIVAINEGTRYKHIDFPRLNFIAKRGGVASYKSVHNIEVIIVEVLENKYGRIDVKLERVDGKKFFNFKKSVTANYVKALAKGELKHKS